MWPALSRPTTSDYSTWGRVRGRVPGPGAPRARLHVHVCGWGWGGSGWGCNLSPCEGAQGLLETRNGIGCQEAATSRLRCLPVRACRTDITLPGGRAGLVFPHMECPLKQLNIEGMAPRGWLHASIHPSRPSPPHPLICSHVSHHGRAALLLRGAVAGEGEARLAGRSGAEAGRPAGRVSHWKGSLPCPPPQQQQQCRTLTGLYMR